MNSRNGLTALLNSATHRIAERLKHIFLGGLWNIPTTTTSLYLRRLVLEYCYVVTTAHCQMGLKLSLDLLYLIKVSELLAYLRGCRPTLNVPEFLLPVKWPVCLSVRFQGCPFIWGLSTFVFVFLPVFLYVGLCVFLSVYLSFSLAGTQIISFPSVFL